MFWLWFFNGPLPSVSFYLGVYDERLFKLSVVVRSDAYVSDDEESNYL